MTTTAKKCRDHRAATIVAAAQGDAAQRADTIIQTAASTPRPLDTLARKVTCGLFVDRLTAMAYDKGARLVDRLTPYRRGIALAIASLCRRTTSAGVNPCGIAWPG